MRKKISPPEGKLRIVRKMEPEEYKSYVKNPSPFLKMGKWIGSVRFIAIGDLRVTLIGPNFMVIVISIFGSRCNLLNMN